MQRLKSSNIFCYPCIYMENSNLGVADFVPNIGDIRMVGYINVGCNLKRTSALALFTKNW